MLIACGAGFSTAAAADAAPAAEHAAPADVTEYAKAAKDPLSDIRNIPLQISYSMGGGLGERTVQLYSLQPDFLVRLTPNWGLITRTILTYADLPGAGDTRATGITDLRSALFVTQFKPRQLIWGVGANLSLPTATQPQLQTGSWAAGPSGVVLLRTKRAISGIVASQMWTLADAGQNARTVNVFFAQPIFTYVVARGWGLTTSPVMTADWTAAPGQRWTIPVGLGFSKTTAVDRQALTVGFEYYNNLVRPASGAAHQLQFNVSFLVEPKPPAREASRD